MILLNWVAKRQRKVLGVEDIHRETDEKVRIAELNAHSTIKESQKTLRVLYETGHPIGDLIERRVPYGQR